MFRTFVRIYQEESDGSQEDTSRWKIEAAFRFRLIVYEEGERCSCHDWDTHWCLQETPSAIKVPGPYLFQDEHFDRKRPAAKHESISPWEEDVAFVVVKWDEENHEDGEEEWWRLAEILSGDQTVLAVTDDDETKRQGSQHET